MHEVIPLGIGWCGSVSSVEWNKLAVCVSGLGICTLIIG